MPIDPIAGLSGPIEQNGNRQQSNAELKEACQAFESVFVTYMLQKMRGTVSEGGMLEGGPGQSMYKEMLDEEYAKSISESGNLGLADLMYQQLITGLHQPQVAASDELSQGGENE